MLPLKNEIERFLYGPWQRTFPHCYWLAELLALGHLLFQLVISAFDFSSCHCLGTALRGDFPPFFAMLYKGSPPGKPHSVSAISLIPALRLQRMLGKMFAAIFLQQTEFVAFFPSPKYSVLQLLKAARIRIQIWLSPFFTNFVFVWLIRYNNVFLQSYIIKSFPNLHCLL